MARGAPGTSCVFDSFSGVTSISDPARTPGDPAAARVERGPAAHLPGLSAAEVAERIAAGQTNDVPGPGQSFTGRHPAFEHLHAVQRGDRRAVRDDPGHRADPGRHVRLRHHPQHADRHRAGASGQENPRCARDRRGGQAAGAPRRRRTWTSTRSRSCSTTWSSCGPGDTIVVDGEVLAGRRTWRSTSRCSPASPTRSSRHYGDKVLSGSFVVAGGGAYRATKVGKEAYAAQLAEEASRFTLVASELRNGVNTILRIVTYLMIPAGALIAYSQMTVRGPGDSRGRCAAWSPHWSRWSPRGWCCSPRIAFAVGVVRLGKRNCLVQELPAIEGLARVDVRLRGQDRDAHRERHAPRAGHPVGTFRRGDSLSAPLARPRRRGPEAQCQPRGCRRGPPARRPPAGTPGRSPRSPPPASGAAPVTTRTATGCSVRPTSCCPASDPVRAAG